MNPSLILFLTAFTINIPFGALRSKAKKFSPAWFLWVHASIPLIIYMRLTLKISPWFIPLLILTAVLGQILGGRMSFLFFKPAPANQVIHKSGSKQ